MSEAIAVFAGSFVSVWALGFQSLNVNQGRYVWASLTSLVICTGSLVILQRLPTAGWLPIAAYYLGCNLGILTGMWSHGRLKAWWDRPSRRHGDVPPRRNPTAPVPISGCAKSACRACGMPSGASCPRLVCERYDEHADVYSTRLH